MKSDMLLLWHIKVFVLFFCFFTFMNSEVSSAEKNGPEMLETAANRDCSVNCLVIACKLLGKNTDKQEMTTICKLGRNGSNFYDMEQAFKKKGLYCKAVNWNIKKLKKWKSLAIAHWPNHFVLVREFKYGTFKIVDPPQMPYNMDVENFAKKWDGKLLLISDKPIILFETHKYFSLFIGLATIIIILLIYHRKTLQKKSLKPDRVNHLTFAKLILLIVFLILIPKLTIAAEKHSEKKDTIKLIKDYIIDVGRNKTDEHKIIFGRVPANSELICSITLQNHTKEKITIKGVKSSCACATTITSQKEILPGNKANVQIKIDSAYSYGNLSKSSLIMFEESHIKPQKVTVDANVFYPGAHFSQEQIYFGKLLAGTEIQKVIKVINYDDHFAKWEIIDVNSSSPFIVAKYLATRGELSCSIKAPYMTGTVNEKVILKIKEGDTIYNVVIPVKGNVIGPLKVQPEKFFLNNINNQTCHKTVELICNKDVDNLKIQSLSNSALCELVPKSRNHYLIKLQIQPPSDTGFFRKELLLKTNLKVQPLLRLEYAGFVQK